MNIDEILILHHSHFDLGYVHPAPVERRLQVRFWRQAVELVQADPRMSWCSELTTPVLDWLEGAGAADVEQVRLLVSQGRIGVGALRWNTTPLSDADDLRRLVDGAAVVRKSLGDPCRVAFQHDVNGLPWPLVGILLDAGVDLLAMAINVHNGGCAVGRHRLFHWRGPDGRRIHVLNGDHYNTFTRIVHEGAGGVEGMQAGWAAYSELLAAWDVQTPFLFLTATHPDGDDCFPPNPELTDWIDTWNEHRVGPPARLVTPEQLRDAVTRIDPQRLPEFSGDWTDFWNAGAGSSATHTALARRARHRSRQAESIAAAASTELDRMLRERIRDQLGIFHEHTWGSSASCSRLASPEVQVQWDVKANAASEAAALADLVRRDALHALAGNPIHAKESAGVLVVNTARVAVRMSPRTLGAWRRPRYRYNDGSLHAIDKSLDSGSAVETWGTVDLPPRSWRCLDWQELAALPASGVTRSGQTLDGVDLSLSFDQSDGRITSLVRRFDASAVLAGDLTLWHETPVELDPQRAREVYFEADWEKIYRGDAPWIADWQAERTACRPIEVRLETTPTAATLIRSYRLSGWHSCELHLELSGCTPGLGVRLVGRLKDEVRPEAWYVGFPVALPAGWRCHFDTAGTMVELDREQLPGACRDWATVDTVIALHHGDRGVCLSCPDAPLVMPNGFGYGLNRTEIPRTADPLLLAWPMNTYWHTNYRVAQPGPVDLRWRLHAPTDFTAKSLSDLVDPERTTAVHPLVRIPARRGGTL